jgi:hypothetical protein
MERYCSADCQKIDWRIHKKMCAQMKNPDQLLPFGEVVKIILEHLKQRKNDTERIRILRYSLSFSMFQFGDLVEGRTYRERLNGDRIDNWNADVLLLFSVCFSLAEMLGKHISRQVMCSGSTDLEKLKELDRTSVPLYEKALTILEPWGI